MPRTEKRSWLPGELQEWYRNFSPSKQAQKNAHRRSFAARARSYAVPAPSGPSDEPVVAPARTHPARARDEETPAVDESPSGRGGDRGDDAPPPRSARGAREREGGASPPATAAAVVESGAQQRQSGAPKLGTATSPVAEALASPPRAPPSLAPVTAPPAEAYCTFPSRPRPTPSNLGVRSRDRIIRLAPLTAVEPFDALAQVPSANRAGVWRPLNAPPLSFNAPPISLNAPPLSLNAPPRSRDSPPRSKRRAAAHKSVETDMEVLAITEDV